MRITIASIIAVLATGIAAQEELSVNGKQCIGGFSTSNRSIPQGDPITGPADAVQIHASSSFVIGKDGKMLAEGRLIFGDEQTLSSSDLPYTVGLTCNLDTGHSLTDCAKVTVNYDNQHWTSDDNPDRCACGNDSGPFYANGYCACYFEC